MILPPSPLTVVIHRIFRYHKLYETQQRSFPLRSLSAIWDKKFLTGKRDTPPNPLPFVIQQIFWNQKFCETQKFSPTKIFRTERPQFFEWRLRHSPLTDKTFRYQKFSKTEGFFYEVFSYCETTNFPLKILIFPSEAKNNFRYQTIFKAQKASSTNFFGTKRQHIFESRSWYSPRRHKISRYQIFFETQKGSSTKFFGTMRQQILERRSWYFPRRQKVFRYEKVSETQKGSSTKRFGTVKQDNLDGKSWCPPPLLSLIFFRCQNFSETQKESPTKFFGTQRQKVLVRKSWHWPLKHKSFRYPKLVTH